MLLLDRLLETEDDAVTRDGLRELARLNQVSEPRLARLAGSPSARP